MHEPKNQLVLRLLKTALDDSNFEFGLVRLTPDERFGYLNRAAREIVGFDVREGDPVHLIPLAEDSQRTLQDALDDRFLEGYAGTASYNLEVQRGRPTPDDDRLVRVTTVPELDADGNLIGSVGLVIDGVIERAELELHRQVQSQSDDLSLYKALDGVLHQLVDFDSLLVVEIGIARNHMRILYESPVAIDRPNKTRWSPIKAFIRPLVDDFAPGELDLAAFAATPEFMESRKQDPNAEHFAQRGFKHTLRLGVRKFGKLVAIVSMLRRADIAYTPAEFSRCSKLPYEAAVNAAIAIEDAEDERFGSELIDKLANAGGGTMSIGRLLVDSLVAYFKFDHVALMRVETARGKVRLVVQAGASPWEADFEQDIGRGLLGRAVRTGGTVNVGDVSQVDDYIKGVETTRSELVVPLWGRSGASCVEEPPSVNWLLNIESSELEAFSDEEQLRATRVLGVAAAVLDRAAAIEIKTALSNSVADAILQTTDSGIITYANPAAQALFGRPFDSVAPSCSVQHGAEFANDAPALRNANIASCLDWPDDDDGSPLEGDVDSGSASILMKPFIHTLFEQSGGFRGQPATAQSVLGEAGKRVLVSAAELEGDVGGRIFVVTDISQRELLTRYGEIRKELSQLGSEIRAPLTLAQAFISDTLRSKDPSAEALQKALDQLRKAMLPLEGLLRVESATDKTPLPCEEVDLGLLLEQMARQLPSTTGDSVRICSRTDVAVAALAARNELVFCIEATLAHVLRHKAISDQVMVTYGCNAHYAFIRIVSAPVSPARPESRPMRVPLAVNNDFLSHGVVEGLLSRMRGRLRSQGSGFGYRLLLRKRA